MSTNSSWIKNLALAGASIVVTLLLAEGALRVAGFSYPNFWQPDPLTGSRLRPGMEGWQRDEGRAFVKINTQGLRDREHAVAKPAGTYRIAVLGDSYAEAMQVDLERTFWSLLPEKLQSCGFAGGKRVETVNFGVSGYGTGHELLTLRERVWPYSPDMVLLAFFPGNDVRNNSRALEGEKGRAYFSLKDGKLFLDTAFRDDPEFVAKQHIAAHRAALQDLRLYQILRRVRAGNIAQHFHNAPVAAALASGAKLTEPGLDEQVFHEPREPKWQEAWDITDRLVVAAGECCRRRDRSTRMHRCAHGMRKAWASNPCSIRKSACSTWARRPASKCWRSRRRCSARPMRSICSSTGSRTPSKASATGTKPGTRSPQS